MTKVGLKDTLSLLAKGYSKKEIDALAAIDDEQEAIKEAEAPAPDPVPEAPASAPSADEPDYKAMYEELLEKNKKTEAKLKKAQQDNIHQDSTPASEEIKRQQEESLTNLVRGFM